MKRILVITTLCILFCCTSLTAFADSSDFKVQTEYLGDGSYYETVLIQNNNSIITDTISTLSNSKTTAGSKTTYYKNSSGKVIWYVKVSGTFTYGGGTSKCTKASVTAESKDSGWKISNKSSWKKSNKAFAKATGTHYFNGIPKESCIRWILHHIRGLDAGLDREREACAGLPMSRLASLAINFRIQYSIL